MDADDEELMLEYVFRIMKALETIAATIQMWEPQATQGTEEQE